MEDLGFLLDIDDDPLQDSWQGRFVGYNSSEVAAGPSAINLEESMADVSLDRAVKPPLVFPKTLPLAPLAIPAPPPILLPGGVRREEVCWDSSSILPNPDARSLNNNKRYAYVLSIEAPS